MFPAHSLSRTAAAGSSATRRRPRPRSPSAGSRRSRPALPFPGSSILRARPSARRLTRRLRPPSGDCGFRGQRIVAAVAPGRGAMDPAVSSGTTTAGRGRPRHHLVEFECRHAFLLHQCARAGIGRRNARCRNRMFTFSFRALADRFASPHIRVSPAGEAIVRAHRDGADQWGLVRASSAADCTRRCGHARPSAYRLDRRMRWLADRLGAIAGHEFDRRPRHILLHSHPGARIEVPAS